MPDLRVGNFTLRPARKQFLRPLLEPFSFFMQIIHDYKTYQSDTRTSLTIGNFDGIHLGHRRILQDLVNTARHSGTHSVVMTFSPHPLEILLPEKAPRLITPCNEK